MRDGARIAAAIGVLEDIDARHKPVRMALKNWGESARYAGAKDRAFVSGLVLDVLRRRRSLAAAMGEDTDRARALASLRLAWDWRIDRIAAAAQEEHGPGALSPDETARLQAPTVDVEPSLIGDYPAWLDPHMARVFGESRAEEGRALAA